MLHGVTSEVYRFRYNLGVSKPVPRLGCVFYRTAGGDEPVSEWLRAFDAEICATVGKDILKIQWRWPISKPLVGTFGEGLCVHGSMKKTQAIPTREIDIARARQRTFRRKS